MFETAMVRVPAGQGTRRIVALPLAVALHVVVLVAVITAHLWAVDELAPPEVGYIGVILDPKPPEPLPSPPPVRPRASRRGQAAPAPMQPDSIPTDVPPTSDEPDSPATSGVPYSVGEPGNGGEPGDGGDQPQVTFVQVGPEPPAVLDVKGDVVAPVVVTRVVPVYPRAAQLAGKQGVVKLRAIVERDGTVTDVAVIEDGVGFGCSEAALDAVRRWRFRPASLRGAPVPVYFEITVAFTLEGRR